MGMSRILVIEDELALLEEIVDTLIFEGFQVSSAANGVEGLEQARGQPPDLIISDIMMPGLDGYGVLLELRSARATATVPFISLTARAGRPHPYERYATL